MLDIWLLSILILTLKARVLCKSVLLVIQTNKLFPSLASLFRRSCHRWCVFRLLVVENHSVRFCHQIKVVNDREEWDPKEETEGAAKFSNLQGFRNIAIKPILGIMGILGIQDFIGKGVSGNCWPEGVRQTLTIADKEGGQPNADDWRQGVGSEETLI